MPDLSHLRARCESSALPRRLPSKPDKARILRLQRDCCFYCGLKFNEWFVWHGYGRRVLLQWDHVVPYVYGFNNSPQNFVAACDRCNKIKSDKIFENLQQLVDYVRTKRIKRKLPVSALWGNVQTQKEMAEVLFSELSEQIFLVDPRDNPEEVIRLCRAARKAMKDVNRLYKEQQ